MTNTQSEKAPLEVIAASLRRERRRTGLSLTEVARRAGIAKSTLSQLESGTGNPSVETLWAICVALDVPFSRLLDPPPPAGRVPAGCAPRHLPDPGRPGTPAGVRAAQYRRGRARGDRRRPGPGRRDRRAGGARAGRLHQVPGRRSARIRGAGTGDAARPALRTRLGLGRDLLDQRGQAGPVAQVSR